MLGISLWWEIIVTEMHHREIKHGQQWTPGSDGNDLIYLLAEVTVNNKTDTHSYAGDFLSVIGNDDRDWQRHGVEQWLCRRKPKVHENNSRYEGGGCLTLLKNPNWEREYGETNLDTRPWYATRSTNISLGCWWNVQVLVGYRHAIRSRTLDSFCVDKEV